MVKPGDAERKAECLPLWWDGWYCRCVRRAVRDSNPRTAWRLLISEVSAIVRSANCP